MVREPDGQTLVEVALVFPVVCLAIAITVQIVASCYNAVQLQRLAYTYGRDLSAEVRTSPAWLTHNPLWGRGAAPHRFTSSEIARPWRPFNTLLLPRVTAEGHLTQVDITSFLWPNLTQHGTAEALIEPPIPGEE